jgi:hypothetical protein
MASTLKVTLSEECSIEGVNYSGSRTKSFSSITSIFRHIVNVTTTEGVVLTFTDAGGDIADLDRDTVEYLRITNLDTTNFVMISFKDGTAAVAAFRLDAGRSLIVPTPNTITEHPQFFVDDDSATSGAGATMLDIDTITADADTAACNIEIFCAMNNS